MFIRKFVLPVSISLLVFSLRAVPVQAQQEKTLTLDDCYQMARQHYPMVKQQDLIKRSTEYSVANAAKGYLPQAGIYGQATYQSDVTKIAVPIPNVTIPSPDKDQYKLYGEVVQPLTDLLIIRTQQDLVRANAESQVQSLEVELYRLRERINQLYFGLLLTDGQIEQTDLAQKDLRTALDKTNSAIANGVATASSADELKAELLKTEQKKTELRSMRKAYAEMLALFTGQPVTDQTRLVKPAGKSPAVTLNRPELLLYDRQKKAYDFQDKLLVAKATPRVSLFFQAGYGKPAFNMFSNEFDFYYIGGAKLSWSLTPFYTLKNERRNLNLNREQIELQRETFLLNTSITMKQQENEISRYDELLKSDREIVALRKSVKDAAAAQLENGTITSGDFLVKQNAEDQARQNLVLHEIQLLLAEYSQLTTTGN